MVRAKVDVIVAAGTLQALQASAGTGIPIVVSANNFDPIEHGYVKTLARPGGTVTGVVLRNVELAEKQVELLTQAFPDRKRVAIFWDVISAEQFAAAERRAKTFGLDVMSIRFDREPYDIQSAFRRMADSGPQMLLALTSPFFAAHAESIGRLAIQHRLPTMFIFRRYAELGGLMSYGAPGRRLCREDLARRQSRRPAGRAAEQIRTGSQPQDCQGDWRRTADVNPAARRRGDRIGRRLLYLLTAANGTSRHFAASR